MLSLTTHGHLPMAAVPLRPIELTTRGSDTSATIDSFSSVSAPEVPTIHNYFDEGVFTDAPTLTTHEPWLLIGLGLVFALPLAQTVYRTSRSLGIIDSLRKLPGLSHILPPSDRTVEAALHDMRSPETATFYDRINNASGWWLESYGAWFARMVLIIALPLAMQDLFQSRYRLLSCALMIAALGMLTFFTLRNEAQANRYYLKTASPTLKRLQLLLPSAGRTNRRQELREFNRLIADTVQLRRQMMGLFNYRPRRRTQPIAMQSATGRHIA